MRSDAVSGAVRGTLNLSSVRVGVFVSPLHKSRRFARRRSSDNRSATALSPWHFFGLGLVALLGTGIMAAVDRSWERAASSQVDLRGPQPKNGIGQIAKASEGAPAPIAALPQAPVPPPLPAPQVIAQVAPPASDGARDKASPRAAAAEISVANPPVAAAPSPWPALPPAIATIVQQAPQASEGPTVTASLAPPDPPTRPPVSALPQQPLTQGAVKTNAAASTECLPSELRAVLADVAARFGEVTVVSTHELNTANHSPGSTRERLHHDCRAVDIRPDRSRIDEIKAYLRSRREVGGVESYRNGVVHMDLAATIASRRMPARPAPAQSAAQAAPADALQAAPPAPEPQPTSPFAPVVNPRYR